MNGHKLTISGNALKIIAAITMLIDHFGMLFFPQITIYRIIGRISFPIFAFLISEGARYTANRLRYILTLSISGIVFHLFYYLFTNDDYVNIFITFSLSILIIYALDFVKWQICSASSKEYVILSVFIFTSIIVFTAILTCFFTISYGFIGVLVPVFASLPVLPNKKENYAASTSERNIFYLRIVTTALSLVFLSISLKGIQIYALLSLPILLFYSGKRGKHKLKYFFYVFYPLHLVLLYGAYMIYLQLK